MINHPNLTAEQLRGLDIEKDMGMVAAAGSGKTRVLTERFLKLLEAALTAGKSPEEALGSLVAITYTRKAAAEMATRIAERCEQLAQIEDKESADFWHHIAIEFSEARIGTIHSLCASIIREYPLQSGFDPNFAEPSIDDFALDRAVFEFAKEIADTNHPLFDKALRLSELLGWRRLKDIIKTAYRSRGAATEELLNLPDTSAKLIELWNFRKKKVLNGFNIKSRTELVDKLRYFCSIARNVGPDDKLASFFLEFEPHIPDPNDISTFPPIVNHTIELGKPGNKGSKKVWAAHGYDVSALRNEYKETLSKIEELAVFLPTETDKKDFEDAEATILFSDIYRFFEGNAYNYGLPRQPDFTDLVIGAERVIRGESTAAELGSRIEGFLVDEFQDTDPLQWKLIREIAENSPGKLFWVGDPKQSIYAFRGAEVSNVALGKEWLLKTEGEIAPISGNFRSTPAVVNFVNHLGSNMLVNKSLIDFDFMAEHQQLHQKRPLPIGFDGTVEIILPLEDENELEPELISRRIWGAVRGDDGPNGRLLVEENGNLRPARWGDIAILFPCRTGGIIEGLKQSLLAKDIPHMEIAGKGFYETDEISSTLDLLNFLADPRDMLALLGLLRGPFFSLSDGSILAASLAGSRDIRAGLDSIIDAEESKEIRKLLSDYELQTIENCRKSISLIEKTLSQMEPSRLIDFALDETGAWATFSGMLNGPQRIANLKKFIDICTNFDNRGLDPLVQYLKAARDSENSEFEAAIESEGTDAVRLMTIHQSKGLQFPVVFVCNLSAQRTRHERSPFIWERLIGPLVWAKIDHYSDKSSFRKLMDAIHKLREEAESRRKLYVAVTRARDHLIMSSNKLSKGFMELVSEAIGLYNIEESGYYEIGIPQSSLKISVGAECFPYNPDYSPPGNPLFMELRDKPPDSSEPPLESKSIHPDQYRWFLTATDLPELLADPMENLHSLRREKNEEALKWGTSVHRFLEMLPAPLPPENDLIQLAEKALKEQELETNPHSLASLLKYSTIRDIFSVEPLDDRREERLVLVIGEMFIDGVIDRLWQDKSGWHIVDFKSDAVHSGDRIKRARFYAPQLSVYRKAASISLGVPETEIDCSIVFTHSPPESIQVPLIDLKTILSQIAARLKKGR